MAQTLRPATEHPRCPLAMQGTCGLSLVAAASGDVQALQGRAGERGRVWAIPAGARGHRGRERRGVQGGQWCDLQLLPRLERGLVCCTSHRAPSSALCSCGGVGSPGVSVRGRRWPGRERGLDMQGPGGGSSVE